MLCSLMGFAQSPGCGLHGMVSGGDLIESTREDDFILVLGADVCNGGSRGKLLVAGLLLHDSLGCGPFMD
jgi:hypothetical protein